MNFEGSEYLGISTLVSYGLLTIATLLLVLLGINGTLFAFYASSVKDSLYLIASWKFDFSKLFAAVCATLGFILNFWGERANHLFGELMRAAIARGAAIENSYYAKSPGAGFFATLFESYDGSPT